MVKKEVVEEPEGGRLAQARAAGGHRWPAGEVTFQLQAGQWARCQVETECSRQKPQKGQCPPTLSCTAATGSLRLRDESCENCDLGCWEPQARKPQHG